MHVRTRGATCQAWGEHRAGRGAQKFAHYCVIATCNELRAWTPPPLPQKGSLQSLRLGEQGVGRVSEVV